MALTPEQEAVIIGIAERALARRARAGRTGAAVQRNNWTAHEAKVNGARNDLRSAKHAFEVARARLEEAQAEYDRRAAGVQARTARLEELEAES